MRILLEQRTVFVILSVTCECGWRHYSRYEVDRAGLVDVVCPACGRRVSKDASDL